MTRSLLLAGLFITPNAFPCDFLPEFLAAVPLGVVSHAPIDEASGLAVSRTNRGVIWVHNDGDNGRVFALRTNGVLLATFRLREAVQDVEDIAVGPGPVPGVNYLYIGDIGGNDTARGDVQVLRVAEPAVDFNWASDPPSEPFRDVEVINLKYPDGGYDAEALLDDPRTGDLFIATKQTGVSRLYRATKSALANGANVTLEFQTEIFFHQVSGGAISANGREVLLRQENFAQLWIRYSDDTIAQALSRSGIFVPVVGPPNEPNGEAIDFLPDGSGYLTLSEGVGQTIFFFPRKKSTIALKFPKLPEAVGSGWQLTVQGCPGDEIAIEKSSDLGAWTILGVVRLLSETDVFIDPDTTARRYYRLRVVE